MLYSFLKFKAIHLAALLVKPVLLSGPVILMTLVSSKVAGAASPLSETFSFLLSPVALQCYPVPQQGGSPLDGTPPFSINPVEWIGWVLGQLCKAVATVFFTLTNQVINWGSGCSQAGLNFITQTPNYIRLDAGKADNWQLFFWDGRFIGAVLLLQFTWTALTIIWNRQNGNGYAGAQEAITRTFLGGILLIISATLLDWAVNFCNLLNGLFADRLTLFDPNSFQVDTNGNIFNTILSMAAALASLLLVMQMATRYIYLILLQFIFPVGSILWINKNTHSYARMIFSSFVATLFVQPLQLAVIYITSNLKDGTRDDTSLSMLFGICGLFLALGLPRVMGSVLGGGTPVGAWGIFAIGRIAAGGITSAVRSSNQAAGGNNGSRGNSNNGGRPGGPYPSGGGRGSNGGNGGSFNRRPSPPNPPPGTGHNGQNSSVSNGTAGNEDITTTAENLRHGGIDQTGFRNASTSNKQNQNGQSQPTYSNAANNPSQSPIQEANKLAASAKGSVATPNISSVSSVPVSNGNRPVVGGNLSPNTNLNSTSPATGTGETVSNKASNSLPIVANPAENKPASSPLNPSLATPANTSGPTTIYRNREGPMPRSSFGKDSSSAALTNTPGRGSIAPTGIVSPAVSATAAPLAGNNQADLVGKQTSPRITHSRPGRYRPDTGQTHSIINGQGGGANNGV
jgi:uncharacterized membrane protein YgcG